MKVIIVVLALVAVATAAATPVEKVAQILRSNFDQNPEGGYSFGFESDDGITRVENGEVKQVVDEENKPQNVVVVRGSYSYTHPDGEVENINYYADETGFHPEGPSIPKPVSRR